MKVYIVLKYKWEKCSVENVYASLTDAQENVNRREVSADDHTTYHIIKKSVKGLNGLQLTVEGKKRYLSYIIKSKSIVENV